MLTRIALLLTLFAAAPASAQTAPTPASKEDLVPVALDTSLGRIVIALDRAHAPVTTANFLRYIDSHRLDGETFYRSMHQGDGGLVQGGVRSDVRKLFPRIAHEPTSQTGLHNVAGAISTANSGRAPRPPTSSFCSRTCRDSTPAVREGMPTGSPRSDT